VISLRFAGGVVDPVAIGYNVNHTCYNFYLQNNIPSGDSRGRRVLEIQNPLSSDFFKII
jgi:hypothetical protein